MRTFGQYVRYRRGLLQLSQTQLAYKTNISRNYVSLIERELKYNVSVRVLVNLAYALSVSPSCLLEWWLDSKFLEEVT